MTPMTIVETRVVCGGVDTHLEVHVAAAIDGNGGVLGVESFAVSEAGYARAVRVAGRLRRGGPGGGGGHRFLWGGPGPVPAGLGGRGRRGGSPQPPGPPPARASPTPSMRWPRPGRRCRARRRGGPSIGTGRWRRCGCWWWPAGRPAANGPRPWSRCASCASAPPRRSGPASPGSRVFQLVNQVAALRPRARGRSMSSASRC